MRIFIFIITSLIISCADVFYEKEDYIEEESMWGIGLLVNLDTQNLIV